MMAVARLLMSPGLMEHRSLEDLAAAEVAEMVVMVVAEMVVMVVAEVETVDTVMETVATVEVTVDTVEAVVMEEEAVVTAVEEVVEEAAAISVVNQATLLGSVPRVKAVAAVVVDTPEVVAEEAVAVAAAVVDEVVVATNVGRTATLPVNALVVVSDRGFVGLLCFIIYVLFLVPICSVSWLMVFIFCSLVVSFHLKLLSIGESYFCR